MGNGEVWRSQPLSYRTTSSSRVPRDALAAAAAKAREMGLDVVQLGNDIQGEASDMGAAHRGTGTAARAAEC